MNLTDLKKPFPPDKISWRVGPTNQEKTSGIALAYIDARDVMERLDEACGTGWQSSYPHANGKTVCSIGIKFGDEWIWRANGAGDTDMEAEKGALSDAFKRAAVCWGIGRYLYDVENIWVKIEPAGKSYKIAQSEYPRLRASLEGKKSPVRYSDDDGQAKEWKDRQITIIKGCSTLPALYAWLEKRCGPGASISDPATGSDMDKTKKKSAEMYGEIVRAFQDQLMAINRRAAAE